MVGGGEIGLEKVEGLLACDGRVVLVAPHAVPELEALAAEGSIEWLRREYQTGDLERTFIAIAATNDTDVNIRVYEDAERRAMLVNIVDVPAAVQLHPARDRAHRARWRSRSRPPAPRRRSRSASRRRSPRSTASPTRAWR